MGFGHRQLFKHKTQPGGASGGYVSPYLLEILSTRSGAPSWTSAAGTLVANTGQTVSCSRASSGYCLGSDGLLHLLGNNTVRVEPTGLLVEGASTNLITYSQEVGGTTWLNAASATTPTVTVNSTDVLDPAGGNTASKLVYPTVVANGTDYSFIYEQKGALTAADSIYLRTASGTATIYLCSNSNVSNYTTCNVTTTWTRFTHTRPGTATDGYFILGADTRAANSGTPGISACTVYAWGAQCENLSLNTSYIPTTTVAASRAADVISVANPLNPSNPGTWRAACTALPGSTWANVYAASTVASVYFMAAGSGANSWSLGMENGDWFLLRTNDNANTLKYVAKTGAFSGSATMALVAQDAAGTLTITPTSNNSGGAGTGIITTQNATLNVGINGASDARSCFNGHLRDIYVDNT